eukprot:495898-Prorocentrum_minimum.AAC.1
MRIPVCAPSAPTPRRRRHSASAILQSTVSALSFRCERVCRLPAPPKRIERNRLSRSSPSDRRRRAGKAACAVKSRRSSGRVVVRLRYNRGEVAVQSR